MVLEVFVVAAFRHVHVDSTLSQTSANVEVHSHVCCSNLVGFGFRTEHTCQSNVRTSYAWENSRNGVSRKATVAHSIFTPSLDLSPLSSSCQHFNTFLICSYALKGTVVDSRLAVAAEDFEVDPHIFSMIYVGN